MVSSVQGSLGNAFPIPDLGKQPRKALTAGLAREKNQRSPGETYHQTLWQLYGQKRKTEAEAVAQLVGVLA